VKPPPLPPSASFLAIAALVGALAAAAPAAADDPVLEPGLLGPNALPALPNVDPVVPLGPEIEAAASVHLDGRDRAAAPYLRLTVPFGQRAALDVEGTPVEAFSTTGATQARLGARDRTGVAPGDVYFGARFLVLREGRLPAFGLRLVVKSASGKGLSSRRFTSAPGYLVDALLGKDLGAIGPARLRALAKVGLFVWQTGPGAQDDAVDWGATLLGTAGPASLAVEWRGYAGWRGRDRPSLLGVTAGAQTPFGFRMAATANVATSRDAPPLELRFGLTIPLDLSFRRVAGPPPWASTLPYWVVAGADDPPRAR
jgi:hypothetical protein